MTTLFLDDERNPEDVTWTALPDGPYDIVRTQTEFQDYILKNGIPDWISFDNDLGTDNGEGIFCAHWLIQECLEERIAWNPNFRFTVHSKNNIAAERITSLLNAFRIVANRMNN